MEISDFINLLNTDLCGEFAAINAYTVYAAGITGIHRVELSEMFEEEAGDELNHAHYFASKIAALGGYPKIICQAITPCTDPMKAVETLALMERDTVIRYSQRAKQAMDLGLHAISVDLENILAEERKHYDDLSMILR